MKKIEKIDYLYELVKQNPSVPISKITNLFADGTSVVCFWNSINREIKLKKEKELTEKEKYVFHTAALIDDLIKFRNKKYKVDYLYELVQQNPGIYLTTTKKLFPDETSISSFWNNLHQEISSKKGKELTEEEVDIFHTVALIENFKKSQKISKKDKIDYIYQLVNMHPHTSLSLLADQFPDGTSVINFWKNLIQEIKLKGNEPLNNEEKYVFHMASLIEVLMRSEEPKMTKKEKIDYLYNLVKNNPDIAISQIRERFWDGTVIVSFWNNLNKEIMDKKRTNLTEEEKYLFQTAALIDDIKRTNKTLKLAKKYKKFGGYYGGYNGY